MVNYTKNMGYKEVKGPLNDSDSEESVLVFVQFVLDLAEKPDLFLHSIGCSQMTGAIGITF